MSREIDQYTRRYASLQSSIQSALVDYARSPSAEKKALLEGDFNDCDSVLLSIERELRSLGYQEKEAESIKVSSFKSSLAQLKSQFEGASSGSRRPEPVLSKSQRKQQDDQRQRLLASNEANMDAASSLGNTMRLIDETTETGISTAAQLQAQREQMLKSKQDLSDADDILDRTKKTLGRMRRKLMTNKLIQFVIILVELFILGLVIYFKYVSKT